MNDSPSQKSNLMPIGRFAAACRLIVKALRYYDERGVLKPAFVDSQTGYRYYRSEQSRDAVMLAMLRSLDIPLDMVKKMLSASGDDLRNHLSAERARVEGELSKKRHALSAIERLAHFGDLMPYEIAIRHEPDYRLASKSIETTVECMVEESGALVYALLDEVEAFGVSPTPPYMCVNEAPDANGRIIVHACVGVADAQLETNSFTFLSVPGGPVAWLTHVGAYEELGIAYHALCAWAQQRGHEQRSALREIYRNDPADTPAHELITEVILPIREGGGAVP